MYKKTTVILCLLVFIFMPKISFSQGSAQPIMPGLGIGQIGGLGSQPIIGGMTGAMLPPPSVIISNDPPASILNETTGKFQILKPLLDNDFQKYILETAGIKLNLFGSEFFDNLQFIQKNQTHAAQSVLNSFDSNNLTAVSGDYLIGPGDQLLIRGWGSLEIDVRATVNRNGNILIPKIGAINLSGVKFSQSEIIIKKAVAKFYKDFDVSVTMGQLRAITIFVVGQARRPGSYVVNNSSTFSSAIFGTGGPNSVGSMRQIQLKRSGNIVAEFDLYDFLTKGSTPNDLKIIDGDIIVIPMAKGFAAIYGKSNIQAVFELKSSNEKLEKIIELSGGISVTSDINQVSIDRINPLESPSRTITEVRLDKDGLNTLIKNGDIIKVNSISSELASSITLRGNVSQSKRVPWKNGMRISDLIPNKEILISKESIRRQNEVLFDINQKERTQRERENIPEDLLDDLLYDSRLDNKSIKEAKAKQLFNNDINLGSNFGQGVNIAPTINNIKGGLDNRQNQIRFDEPKNIESFREARSTRLFSSQVPIKFNDKNYYSTLTENIGGIYDEINWDYAVIERFNRTNLSTSIITFNLGKVLSNINDPENHLLESGDIITIFSINDIRVPNAKRKIIVRVEGELAQPGIYQILPGENLYDLLRRAGGLTKDAYLYGSAFFRDEVRKSQTENLEKLLRKLEAELSGQLAQASQSLGGSSDASLSQARILSAQLAQKQSLERIKNIRPEGRIALGLTPNTLNFINELPNIRLQNGDRFYIPPRPDFVYIYGAVNTESALIFKEGRTVKDYLELAGVSSGAEKDSVILIRADGSALSKNTNWFNTVNNLKVFPGDSIVVPEKIDREANWSAIVRNAKDITQIFYQLGLGAAGLKALGY